MQKSEQNCPPCQHIMAEVKKLIAEAEARIENKMQAMVEAKMVKVAADASRVALFAGNGPLNFAWFPKKCSKISSSSYCIQNQRPQFTLPLREKD